MKIKNPILASMLKTLGVDIKAELTVDDTTGKSITFPEITETSEIAVGVAVTAEDGTYTVADGENTISMVVLSGVVDSVEVITPDAGDPPTAEVDAELVQVLETLVQANTKANASIVALQAELKDLKISLKHNVDKAPAAAAGKHEGKFKIID